MSNNDLILDHHTIDLIRRIAGENALLLHSDEFILTKGVKAYLSEIEIPADALQKEEKAILNYYPIQDGDMYLKITYFPDIEKLKSNTVQILQLIFQPDFFQQWSEKKLFTRQPFTFDRSAEQAFNVKSASRESFDYLLQHLGNESDFIICLQKQIAAISLLKFAVEAFFVPDEADSIPACSFLANNYEREKILNAHEIILSNLSNPLTIRELSRQCGINECYLKKGFKAMFGKTIYEFREQERINKSKELLLSRTMNINEVASEMGYTSHAYFSTSFKKITGMKPCDLFG